MSRSTSMRSNGFTLVELMVGLVVGLFVALASISVFVGTRTLQTVSASDTRMNENARLALDLLHQDLRSAGFQGCHQRNAEDVKILLASSSNLFLDTNSGMNGAHGNGSTFAPPLNATLAALADPNSDVLSVRVPVEPMSLGLSVPMTSPTGVPQVGVATAGNQFQNGDIALIANCKAGAIFQITAADPKATGSLDHATGGGFVPGNTTTDLGAVFRGDTAVYRLQTRHYYIADSVARPGTKSLWRYTVPSVGIAPAQEVVAGVDRMVVSYGIDSGTGGERNVNRYVGADALTTAPQWEDVVSVRVQLLTATVRDGMALSAQSASFAGSTVVGTDRRKRAQVTEVVTLRSRAP